MSRHPIQSQSPEGAIDYLEVDGSGIIRIHTWYHSFDKNTSTLPSIRLNGAGELAAINHFRVSRKDVMQELGSDEEFLGVVFEFLCGEEDSQSRAFEVYWKSECIASGADETVVTAPSYPYLIDDERVFHRDWIYCSGLPIDYVNEEVLSLAKTLSGAILDFGCGTGSLVAALKKENHDIRGLEIDRPEIRDALPSERKEWVDLYDGSLPLPYEDNAFGSVIMSEVLEHLEASDPVMAELARVCRGQLLVTVPDLSGVPLNHKNGVVPWHLLESTHVNFFNPRSLEVFLSKWFSHIELFRIGRSQTNDTQWWGGLMAIAKK